CNINSFVSIRVHSRLRKFLPMHRHSNSRSGGAAINQITRGSARARLDFWQLERGLSQAAAATKAGAHRDVPRPALSADPLRSGTLRGPLPPSSRWAAET